MKAHDPSAIATELRAHLLDTKETQAQFAARAGVSEPTISRLLGESPPQMRPATLASIVSGLPTSARQRLGSVAPRAHRPGPRTVFLSSTFLDLETRRRQVIEAIEGFEDLRCIAMERFTASPQPALAECLAEARDADLYIGILAYRYGWIPDGETRSITELEHDAAHAAGVDRLVFVVDERRAPMKPDIDADPMPARWELQGKLAQFKARLSATGITPRPFADDAELIRFVMHAIVQWREQRRLPQMKVREVARDEGYHAEMRYRDALLAEHRFLQFVGFPSRQRAPMNLDELFVPLLATAQHFHGEPGSDGDGEPEDAAERAKTERREAERGDVELSRCLRLAHEHQRRGVVIKGHPGAGKTTQLRRLVFGLLTQGPAFLGLDEVAADEAQGDDTRPLLPVFVPLRRVTRADIESGLRAAIARTLPAHAGLDEGFAEELLERGRLVLLLDGLDEVEAELRDDVAAWITRAASDCPDSYFVVTTRFAGYSTAVRDQLAPHVLDLEVKPLADKQIEKFVDGWYRLVEVASTELDRAAAEARGAAAARELLQRLREPAMRASRVFEFTANPLLLTIICRLHRDGSHLPDDNARLYHEASQVLLESWRRAKGLEVEVNADQAATVLRPLAHFLHSQEGRTAATCAELTPIIEAPLRSIGWQRPAEDFLRAIRDDSGILVGRGDDQYQFLHLGFQEYFAALDVHARIAEHALDDRDEVDRILAGVAAHFGESWWQEVVLLLLKHPDPPHLFAPLFRWLGEHDFERLGRHDQFLFDCIRESFVKRAEPFGSVLQKIRLAPESGTHAHRAMLACARAVIAIDATLLARLSTKLVEVDDEELFGLLVSNVSGHAAKLAKELVQSREHKRRMRRIRSDPALNAMTQTLITRRVHGPLELTRIEAGRFAMGGNRHAPERPIHEVRVPSFWLATTPVTNAQYREFVDATGNTAPQSWKDRRFNADDQPVVTVDWHEAQAFCKWAGLRLPSEAEWEYACRAGTTTEFWFGDDERELARHAWCHENSEGTSHPVRQKAMNPWGLFDMHGNVWEWCEDSAHDGYAGAPTDGSPRFDRRSSHRVLRGGSWIASARHCRSAQRAVRPAHERYRFVGFRPACSSLD